MKNQDSKRQQRFLLVLPLLLLPFLTLAFWALGGGQATGLADTQDGTAQGLRLQLPAPRLNDNPEPSKLSIYQEAARQAGRMAVTSATTSLSPLGLTTSPFTTWQAGDTPGPVRPEENEALVTQRLEQLTALVSTGSAHAATSPQSSPPNPAASPAGFSQEVARLESLMQAMGSRQGEKPADPELQQLETLLERILDIQHPDRVRTRESASPAPQEAALSVQPHPDAPQATLLGDPHTLFPPEQTLAPGNSFFGLEGTGSAELSAQQAHTIPAAILGTQTVVPNGIVRMRLLQDAFVGGQSLPKGSLVYGSCRVKGERLLIEVASIQLQQDILPVRLRAYDLDGLEGLHIPGSITREAARQGTEQLLSQPLSLPALHPSWGVQAASAGISATQRLFSRKIRQVKVTLKAGHQLLLRHPL